MERFSVGAQEVFKVSLYQMLVADDREEGEVEGEGSCERLMGSQRVHLSTATDNGTANGGELRT